MSLCTTTTTPTSALQKHATADRSLHTDRRTPSSLVGPQSHFRTPHSPALGESEFSLFSSLPAPPLPPASASTSTPTPTTGTGWAGDFAKLYIDHHVPSQSPAPLLHQQGWGWCQEFKSQHPQQQQPFATSDGFAASRPRYVGPSFLAREGERWPARGVQGEERIDDDEAFEMAFASVSASIESPRPQVGGEEERGDEAEKAEDSDDLARTAGHLLSSLEGNQSRKFRESTFLALMRRVRDREVKVEGGRIVEV